MKKTALITALAVAALGVSGCTSDATAEAPAATESAKTTAADPLKAAAEAAGVDGLEITKSSAKGKVIVAQFPVTDHMTKRMVSLDAKDDAVKILKAVRDNVPSYTKVFVQGSFATTDDYGNETNPMVINASYGKATVDKINFDGIDSGTIWTIRDGGKINAGLLG
ncbi:hypothetical protein [Arthrobacter rhombi]|uniref:hypothetical protein n=1 Tax=Arthrobacter rhombi TaxID=71253 RepID=UPI003FCF4B54